MYAYATQANQQEKMISGAVAAGMHLMFLALLVFGVNWQRHVEQPANVVDLWPSTSPAPPKAEPTPEPPAPPPQPEVKPPEPKVAEPLPAKAAPKPEPAKPDIAFKDKAEKEKRVAEEKQKETKKKEEEVQAAQKAQAEAQRAANEQAEAQRRAAEQAASAQAKLIAEYTERIRNKIQRLVVMPPNVQPNIEAEFDVVLLPDGNPLGVKLRRSSGNPSYDNAVERAILKAQPLPLPPDQALFRYFRELKLAFRPQQ